MADTIRPTEKSALQQLLGEAGVVAQKTGKSLDEALIAVSKSSPVKAALARMIVTEPLQSAGAALQDYTGTPRDITTDRPYHPGVRGGSWNTYQVDPRMLDVMQFALPAASVGMKGAKIGAKAALSATNEAMMRGLLPVSPNFVVKPKGGNWLKGDVEATISGLKPETFDYAPGEYGYATAAEHPNNIRSAAISNWIDKKLVPYIKNEMGTPEDSVRLGIEKRVAAAEARKAQGEKRIAKLQMAVAEGERLGVPSQLTRDRLATEIDNVANQYDVDMASVMHSNDLNYNGRYPPRDQMSTTAPSKHWEGASDLQIGESTAEEILSREKPFLVTGGLTARFRTAEEAQRHVDHLHRLAETEPTIAAQNLKSPPMVVNTGPELQDPWLTKVAPETPVYSMSDIGMVIDDELKFDHLTDELKNSLNPNSGLPTELLLSPDKMPKTVDDAIAHVGKINAWRAAQSVELNRGRAFNPAVVMHKDYPDQPYAWYEFKMPDKAPEGWVEDVTALTDPRKANLDPNYAYGQKTLEDALKFEGETMQHCVGGYCPDVVEGRSRIFSLKNKKTGESHTTVETRPGGKVEDPLFDAGVDFEGQAHDYVQRANPRLDTETDEYMEAVHERANDLAAAWNAKQLAPEVAPSRIVQIKGKQNRAPVDKYLPYVQDFVKSQPWSEVGDLKNTGLRRKSDLIDEFTSDQLDAIGPGEYMTEAEYTKATNDALDNLLETKANPPVPKVPPTEGMKDGGAVHMQAGGPAKALANAVSKRVASSTAEMIAEMMAKNVHPVLDRLQTTVSPKIAHAASTSKETGLPLVQHLTDKERDKIAGASLILRRSQLGDIFGPKGRLLNVHESGRTTAAAGAKPSIAIRSKWEPEFLGGTDINYGYLTSNPLSTTKLPVELRYPVKGDPYLVPADDIIPYGSYGLELGPEARSRSTFTLGDSLDAGRGNYATAESIVNPPGPYHDIAQPGSILHGLAKDYWDTYLPIVEKMRSETGVIDHYAAEEMMKNLGFAGRFNDYLAQEGLGQMGNMFPRLSPRPINDPRSTPLMNTERVGLKNLDRQIDRSLPSMGADYVEGQVHGGVQPQDITRLYDFNYEPSLAVEKKAKKFGIEYVPMPNDTIYSLVQREQPQTKRELAELLGETRFRNAKAYLPSDKPQAARAEQEASEPAPKFGKSFKDGGIVQHLAEGTTQDTISPTEKNPLQSFLGEAGAFAQSTGKSLDEALASSSTKGSNVYLTALAKMLLADPLRSAGAALQDYTGTPRDITPKQPYHPGIRGGSWNTYQIDPRALDVMSIALPIASASVKGANIAAKGATRAIEQGAKNLAMPTDPFFAGQLGSQRGAFNLFGKKPTAQAPTTEVDLSKRNMFRLPEATPTSENALVPKLTPVDYMAKQLLELPTDRRKFLSDTSSLLATPAVNALFPGLGALTKLTKSPSVVDLAALEGYARVLNHIEDAAEEGSFFPAHWDSSEIVKEVLKDPEVFGLSNVSPRLINQVAKLIETHGFTNTSVSTTPTKMQTGLPTPELRSTATFVDPSAYRSQVEQSLFKPDNLISDVPTNPLAQMATTLANKPTSRREFLQQTGATAARQMIPDMLVPAMEIAKPVEAVAKTVEAAKPFTRNPVIDKAIVDQVDDLVGELMYNETLIGPADAYYLMRDSLVGKVGDKELAKADQLRKNLLAANRRAERNDIDVSNPDLLTERQLSEVEQLTDFINKHLETLSPNQHHEMIENLRMGDTSPADLHYDIMHTVDLSDKKGTSVRNFVSPDEFEAYLTQSNLYDTNAAKQARKAKKPK